MLRVLFSVFLFWHQQSTDMNEPVVFVAVHAHTRTPDWTVQPPGRRSLLQPRQTGLGPGGLKAGGVCETEA